MEIRGVDQVGGDYIYYPRRINLTHDMDRAWGWEQLAMRLSDDSQRKERGFASLMGIKVK
jgi:hypothetical protein